jgi:hypothetical protein
MEDEKYNNKVHDQKVRRARTAVIKAALKWNEEYHTTGDYFKSDRACEPSLN